MTGLYTRWDSFAPTQQKISLLKSLVSRAKIICSESALAEKLANLKVIFASLLGLGFHRTGISEICCIHSNSPCDLLQYCLAVTAVLVSVQVGCIIKIICAIRKKLEGKSRLL